MAQGKRDSDGNIIGRTRRQADKPTDTRRQAAPLPAPSPHQEFTNDSQLKENMTWLCNQSGGWLRIIPSNDEGIIYMKWKFNSGKYPNHYVMARVEYWQMSYGIALLRDKVQAVYDGNSKPVADKPFS